MTVLVTRYSHPGFLARLYTKQMEPVSFRPVESGENRHFFPLAATDAPRLASAATSSAASSRGP
jgi:hypothetical protein